MTSQAARVAVIAQMIFDLLVLGLVVKVFLGAVESRPWTANDAGRTPNRRDQRVPTRRPRRSGYVAERWGTGVDRPLDDRHA